VTDIGPEAGLASWAAGLDLSDVPAPTVAWAKLVLLDAVASGLTGRQAEERPQVEALARALGGVGTTAVLGGERLSMVSATFLNAFQVTGATVCDVHRPTLCHVTPEVVPAVLSSAEASNASGVDILAATLVGLETTVRVASAFVDPTYRARGWHAPGIAGPFGGAAAVGRLVGLTGDEMAMAFGHAGGQAAGTFAALGTSAVKFHQARGAVSGLLAGMLAHHGLDAPRDVLTAATGGLLQAYGDGGAPEHLTADLGVTWRANEISLRRWPGASSTQALIEAMLLLGPDAGDSEALRVRVSLPPRSYELSGRAGWTDQLSALQSARYVAAVVLRDRSCWLEQFDAAHLADPWLDGFAGERVDVRPDASIPASGVAVEVDLADGRTIAAQVDVPLGSPDRPLAEPEVIAKLEAACLSLGWAGRVEPIADMIRGLEDLAEASQLTGLLTDEERDLEP
jgi:2-methylcitrate dehydratase PrpD